jgi:hypothetical protein
MGAGNQEGSVRVEPASARPIERRTPASNSHVTVGDDFTKESNSAADDREGDLEGGGGTTRGREHQFKNDSESIFNCNTDGHVNGRLRVRHTSQQ